MTYSQHEGSPNPPILTIVAATTPETAVAAPAVVGAAAPETAIGIQGIGSSSSSSSSSNRTIDNWSSSGNSHIVVLVAHCQQ